MKFLRKSLAGLALVLLPLVAGAQSVTYSNLYNFSATSFSGSNSGGAHPYAGTLLVSNTLYGTTDDGGPNGWGTIYKLNPDGTGFQVLHAFDKTNGANPLTGLLLLSNVLYGTAGAGGPGNGGTLFRINPDGPGFQNLFYFTNGVANGPSDLLLSSNTFYGTAGGRRTVSFSKSKRTAAALPS